MTTPATQPPTPQDNPLGYAAAPPRRRRKWVRRITLWLVLPAAAVALLLLGFVPLRNKFAFLHHQRRSMTSAAAPDTVAYSEDPATLARLTGGAFSGPGWATLTHNGKAIAYYLVPTSLRRMEVTPDVDLTQGLGPVFLHARAAPGGAERLVVVKVDSMRGYAVFPGSPLPKRTLHADVMRPATLRARPAVTKSLWTPAPAPPAFGELTFFAGQPDPSDASHFTIDYQTPAGRGTIDGWLQPDDAVTFSVRDGPLARVAPPGDREEGAIR